MDFIRKHSEILELFALLLLAVIQVYFSPVVVRDFGFLVMLPIIWKSKKDYLWIAFFFILSNYPGDLFGNTAGDAQYRMPFFSLAKGISFTMENLFFIVLFIKAQKVRRHNPNYVKPFFSKELNYIVVLFVLLIAITPIMGFTPNSAKSTIIAGVNLMYVYACIILLSKEDSFMRLLKILFPFVFIAILFQIYYLINLQHIGSLIDPTMISDVPTNDMSDIDPLLNILRPIELPFLVVVSFCSTLFLLYYRTKNFSKAYLWVVNVTSFVSIQLTATRGYFIACLVCYAVFLLLTISNIKTLIYMGITFLFIGIIIFSYFPSLTEQILDATTRYETLESGLSGDISFGGSARRYDVRTPKVIEGFKKSSIVFGSAFSKIHDDYDDPHTGFVNLLFNVGIIGFLFFLALIGKLLLVCFHPERISFLRYPKILKVAAIPLIFVIVLNFSNECIGFGVESARTFIQMWVLLVIHFAYRINRTTKKNNLVLRKAKPTIAVALQKYSQ